MVAGRVLLFTGAMLVAPMLAVSEGGLRILTLPDGIVSGQLDVEVDLGSSPEDAALYLDGARVCTLAIGATRCRIGLGPDPRVHLLELVRRSNEGEVVERAERWLNLPGRESMLDIRFAVRPIGSMCGARVEWDDPRGQDPVRLEAIVYGTAWPFSSDGRTFAFPCPEEDETVVVSVAATFPDGRRAETSVLTGATAQHGTPGPYGLALWSATGGDPCAAVASTIADQRSPGTRPGVEIAFVLDPTVDFRALASHGRSESGAPGDPAEIRDSWASGNAAFADADGLWFVAPESDLPRFNGFANGRASWLGTFFDRGTSDAREGSARLADAVAEAGRVAGAAPRGRAVVLVLGAQDGPDSSRFSPGQVRTYLGDIGVPLYVLRTTSEGRDGWPQGRIASDLSELAAAFHEIREEIDAQCVEWFPGTWGADEIVAALPAPVSVAGRAATSSATTAPVWRRAEVETAGPGLTPVSEEPVAREKIEVTAVTILVSAVDRDGNPVTDLMADGLQVTEDGKEMPVLGVERLSQLRSATGEVAQPETIEGTPDATEVAPSRQIVPVAVYVERQLAGSTDLSPALLDLANRASWLVRLGPVDIVVAESGVKQILAGATDAAEVEETLRNLAKEPAKGHAIERIRTEYLREIRKYPERGTQREAERRALAAVTSAPDNSLRVRTMTIARSSIFQEDALLHRVMARMNDWALSRPATGPRLLFLVGTGFDEDPVDFYARFLELEDPSISTAARAEFIHYNQATRVQSVGHELAAAGWLVIPVATRISGQLRSAAEYSGGETFQAFLSQSSDVIYTRDVDFMLLDPIGAQQHLAESSGGRVVKGGKGIDKLITESSGWYRLTYQVARPPDGEFHEVAVTCARTDVDVRSTDVVVSGTSEGRAGMRVRELLRGSGETGELPVSFVVGEPRASEGKRVVTDLEVSTDFGPIAPFFVEGGRRVLRFSIGVLGERGDPDVHHELATVIGAIGGMQFNTSIRWSGEPVEIAVVVEDLTTGIWGGAAQRTGE